ncbi:MAG TPA: DUF177 domain-containing protein [Candidatus Corynebacterium gallistercoris]|uniref:DUF177 domain-containing protein n=1 Tax=Candidatus Corynebacterium gallistercoris TaxID=2838530 RepID=A0A9D1RZV4_9CORY|nr:DUF177 domain-containing protein [Candidatus Corynebacterium gallistercoris]
MSNPFKLSVSDIATGLTEPVDTSGPSPVRWGGNMLAVEEGAPVEVHGSLSNVGEAVMANVDVSGHATGTCALCLQEITTEFRYTIGDVFGFSSDFISGEDGEEDEEPLLVSEDMVDITQLVVDEAGLNAPFSPVCANYGQSCQEDTPAPDGVSEEVEQEEKPDPRWAALQKFKDAAAEEDAADEGESEGQEG